MYVCKCVCVCVCVCVCAYLTLSPPTEQLENAQSFAIPIEARAEVVLPTLMVSASCGRYHTVYSCNMHCNVITVYCT